MMRPGLTQHGISLAVVLLCALLIPADTLAHCDGLDGPVVKAAQRALATNNVSLVLIWVREEDEPKIREAFQQTLAVRAINAAARDLADRYFFETLVRIHRQGEGAPYTGLKPAGRNLGPAIPAADEAIEHGDLAALVRLLSTTMEKRLRRHFQITLGKKEFDPKDVASGREYVSAYVRYIHYVERLYEAAAQAAEGHYPEPDEAMHE